MKRKRRIVTMGAIGAMVLAGSVTGATASEDEGFGTNLSVPAIFVPSSDATDAPALRGGECGAAIAPTGSTSLVYPGYYLQRTESVWQAECAEVSSLDVTANWGDNLTNRPVLSSRQPIRVEIGLEAMPLEAMDGFVVEKLTPELDDRFATYGTRGDVTTFATVRVFDSGLRLRIERIDGPGGVVYDGPMSAEINSVGAVVYGYNWGTKGKTNRALPGTYRITVTTNNTRITGVDASDVDKATFNANSSSLIISVAPNPGLKGKPGVGSGNGSGGGSGNGQGRGGPQR